MQHSDELFSIAYYRPLVFNAVRIVLILVFAYIAILLIGRVIRGLRTYAVKAMLRVPGASEYEVTKRAETVSAVLRKTFVAAIWVVAIIMSLQEMSFDVRPLLAGAGVAGIALGFGAQSLVKDVLAGFFFLLDDQIRINDVVEINGTGGLVEGLNLRTTILRSEDGAVHTFPNGGIQKISNLTRDYSYFVFSLSVNYREDTDRVSEVLREIGANLMQEEPYRSAILAPLEIYGVDRLADSGVVVKGRCKTQPMKQWMVGREMNRRIKKRFEEVGIDMPFPTRTIHLLDDSQPDRTDELKRLVREVLEEERSQSE